MNSYRESEHLRAIFVKYLGPTKTKNKRLKFDDKRWPESQTVEYSEDLFEQFQEQAYKQLLLSGFNIVSRASTKKNFIFLVDNWDENYKSVKEIIKTKKLWNYEN